MNFFMIFTILVLKMQWSFGSFVQLLRVIMLKGEVTSLGLDKKGKDERNENGRWRDLKVW